MVLAEKDFVLTGCERALAVARTGNGVTLCEWAPLGGQRSGEVLVSTCCVTAPRSAGPQALFAMWTGELKAQSLQGLLSLTALKFHQPTIASGDWVECLAGWRRGIGQARRFGFQLNPVFARQKAPCSHWKASDPGSGPRRLNRATFWGVNFFERRPVYTSTGQLGSIAGRLTGEQQSRGSAFARKGKNGHI